MGAQQIFESTFDAQVNEDYSRWYWKASGYLEHALSKVDFSIGADIYMLKSNLALNLGKTAWYQ